jgi:TonB-dependent receptor
MERLLRLTPPVLVRSLLVSLTLLLTCASALAQTGRGVIAGRATDSAGAVLQGARVELQPLGSLAICNSQGEFSFLNVPAGSYTLSVSYVGFTVFTQTVTVKAGETPRVDAVLNVAGSAEQVTVTTERQFGEAEAINRERTSDNILQVLPVEIITSLPNTNIADALGRLPSVTLERDEGEGKYVQIRGTEPRLSNVTINGIEVPSPESGVRQIKLDVIPANLVDSVEINKTLSADQDAGGIGGSVNLVTKRAQDKPTFYVNGYIGYNPIEGGRESYDIDGVLGKRFGANKKFGALFGWSYDWNGRGIDDVEPVPIATQPDTGPAFASYDGYDQRQYAYYRTRYGFTGSLDYKLNEPLSGLYLHFIYSHFNNFGDRWVYSPSFGTPNPPSDPNALFATSNQGDGSTSFNVSIRRPVEVIGSLDFGGKHVFSKWLLSYDFAAARSASEDHGYAQANFVTLNDLKDASGNPSFTNPLNNIPFTLDLTHKLAPKFIPGPGINLTDPTLFRLDNGDVSHSYSPQVNLAAAFAAQRTYNWRDHFGTFDFGFKFRNAHKFEDAKDEFYFLNPNNPSLSTNPNDPSLTMSNFLQSFTNPNFYGGRYGTFGPTVSYSKVQSFLNSSANALGCPGNSNDQTSILVCDQVSTQQSSFPNNYDLIEKVTSGFLMNSMQFGRTRVQAGVRFEGTNESLLGNVVNFDPNSGLVTAISPLKRTSGYLDVLPSIQFRFDLGHDTDIRASYGRGIARPNYSDLPPTFQINGQNNQVGIGNPDEKPTRANNYDLLVEKYLQPLGLIQGGVFFKQLNDPIYGETLSLSQAMQLFPFYDYNNSNINPGTMFTTNINGGNAHLWGFEISYIQHWTFLPGLLSGLGFSGNYSWTTSTAHNINQFRNDSPALQRQAPNSWNISPTYDKGRLSMRLGISHNDENIFSYQYSNLPSAPPLGVTGPSGDTYLYPHTQVDAQGSFRMYRNLQLIISGLNLTNEVFGFYNGSSQFVLQREFYRATYAFGLRYTLGGEDK